MTVAEKILEQVKRLPESLQAQVLEFVQNLESKAKAGKPTADENWSALSLSQAMRGMESETSPYEMDDVKEAFR